MQKFYDCGIDLGTTNSCIAIPDDDNKYTIIENQTDRMSVTPSAVMINNKGRMLIGQRAYNSQNVDDLAIQFKRQMGTSKTIHFASAGLDKTPEELSAEILKRLRSDAEQRLGRPMNNVVITVPAAFRTLQSEATNKAGKLAGFQNIILLQEPIAAAVAYGATPDAKDKCWMVFDYGGGTLDVAIISTRDNRLEVINSEGDNYFGGSDIDRMMFSKIVVPQLKQSGYTVEKTFDEKTPAGKSAARRILLDCETVKIDLSSRDSATLEIFDLEDDNGEPIEFECEITRAQLDALISETIDRSIQIAKKALDGAQVSAEQLDKILLVGGSTFIPLVRKRLTETFKVALDCSINKYLTEYQSISSMLRSRIAKTEDLFDAQLAILHAWMRMGRAFYLSYATEEEKKREEGTRQAFEDCFSTAVFLAEKTSEIRLPAAVFQAVVIAERLGSSRGLCDEIYRICNEYIARNMSVEDMGCYDIPYDEGGRPMIGRWERFREKRFPEDYVDNDNPAMDEKEERLHVRYIVPFVDNPEERIPIFREIMEDLELSLCEKLETIESCLEEISLFSEWLRWHQDEYFKELKGKDHTTYIAIMDFCNDLLNSHRARFMTDRECTAPYLDIKFLYFKNRMLIACIEEDKEKVKEILREFLDIFRRNYDRFYIHKDSVKREEDRKPYLMMPYGAPFIEVMHVTSRIGKAAWTVMERIEALELERRIPEQLSPDLQEEIDRILADEFYDVIDHVNHAMAYVTDDSDSWLTREEADKAVEYQRMLHARLDEIIDSGYKMRKKKD